MSDEDRVRQIIEWRDLGLITASDAYRLLDVQIPEQQILKISSANINDMDLKQFKAKWEEAFGHHTHVTEPEKKEPSLAPRRAIEP